jgi:hypothetical protein
MEERDTEHVGRDAAAGLLAEVAGEPAQEGAEGVPHLYDGAGAALDAAEVFRVVGGDTAESVLREECGDLGVYTRPSRSGSPVGRNPRLAAVLGALGFLAMDLGAGL